MIRRLLPRQLDSRRVLALGGAALMASGACLTGAASTPTLPEFGYGHLGAHFNLTRQRPLLVVLAEFTDGSMAHPPSYYDKLVFNPTNQPRSVNGYYQEISNGRFSWSRAGIVWAFLSPDNRYTNIAARVGLGDPERLADKLYTSNIVHHVFDQFNFGAYDTDGNHIVQPPELTLALVVNENGGATRDAGHVQPAGSAYAWRGLVAIIDHDGEFLTFCHELAHQFGSHGIIVGALDLYADGCLNGGLTLMSCTAGGVVDDPATCHIDPWHKMQYGWCEPRIRSLTTGGTATIPAAQLHDPNAPLLLYHPAVGPGEFWILEYRTTTSPVGPGYDAQAADSGLAIWHVQHGADFEPLLVPRIEAGPIPGQRLWRLCVKCEGLHFIADEATPVFGPCPEGGMHSVEDIARIRSSPAYRVVLNTPDAPGQHGWAHCHKCQGLFFGARQATSHCPAGGTHDGSQSGDYALVVDQADSPGEHGWRWCPKCQGIYFGPRQADSTCPADGLRHDGSGNGDYVMFLDGGNYTVWNEARPNLQRGGSSLWVSNLTTPYLRLNGGAELPARIHVHPFSPGDGSITVSWGAASDVWVDFTFGGEEQGTFLNPFDTLGEGIAAVVPYGTVHIKAGSTPATPHIFKPLTLRAYGGWATIGR